MYVANGVVLLLNGVTLCNEVSNYYYSVECPKNTDRERGRETQREADRYRYRVKRERKSATDSKYCTSVRMWTFLPSRSPHTYDMTICLPPDDIT